jgi:hypothetical protein
MPRKPKNPRLLLGLLALCGVGLLTLADYARAVTPKIDRIEPFVGNQVTIHFDAEANYNYVLQYTETFTNGIPGGTWTNLFVADKSVFFQHYVVNDTRTRKQRFYRLLVYP